MGNVHEIAHAVDPSVHVVYVDIDPIVLAHGRALFADDDTTTVITGDVRDVDAIFADPAVRELIDTTQPFAVLAASILHHLADDEDPYAVAEKITAWLSPGSYLLVSTSSTTTSPARRCWSARSWRVASAPAGSAPGPSSSASSPAWSWWNPAWSTPTTGTPTTARRPTAPCTPSKLRGS